MAERKAKTSAADRQEKAKPQYLPDPAQLIDQLKTLHGWQYHMLELLRRALPSKPEKSPDEIPCPEDYIACNKTKASGKRRKTKPRKH